MAPLPTVGDEWTFAGCASACLSIRCLSVHLLYYPLTPILRDMISVFSRAILMKLGTNIHYASGQC